MEKRIREVFRLNEIKGFVYDEKNNKCQFFFKNKINGQEKLIKGKLVLFNKKDNEILIEKEI